MGHQLREAATSHHDDHDHHGHDHHHPETWLGRIGHALSELVGGHSHDSAEQVDEELEANASGRRALWISLAVLLLTAAVQGLVTVLSGSVALLGDTFHNLADAMTAVPLLTAFALARRPANRRFTYGYGRAEDLAGLFVLAMIALSAVVAGWEAIDRFLHPRPVHHLVFVAAAAVLGFLGNEVVAQYRIRVGRRIGSAALVADGLHARTDGLTSLAVLLGAGGAAAGLRWADPAVGLLIALAIAGVLRSAVRQVGERLMDAVDPELVARAESSLATVDGIEAVQRLHLRWVGHVLRAELTLVVDRELGLVAAHDIARHAEAHLQLDIPRLSVVTVDTVPAAATP